MLEEGARANALGYTIYASMHNMRYELIWYMSAQVYSLDEAASKWCSVFRPRALQIFEKYARDLLVIDVAVDDMANLCVGVIFMEIVEGFFRVGGYTAEDDIFATRSAAGELTGFYIVPREIFATPICIMGVVADSDSDTSDSDMRGDESFAEAYVAAQGNPAA